jgi:acetolactate synthase I/II/III large subunit
MVRVNANEDVQGAKLVADRIAETMHSYGIAKAFGIPGNDVLELIRACEAVGIEFVLAKSEPSAAFMADAFAQVTGRPAACIFALGPGIANGVSGAAGALMERSPVLFLGGEMAANRRQIYNHQVFDHVALMSPVTKYAAELNPERAAQQVAKALDIATSHPRGPVFLNCPADATKLQTKQAPTAKPEPRIHGLLAPADVDRLQREIRAARQPVAMIGIGALTSGEDGSVRQILEQYQIPFFATYKAKGVVPDTHDLCLGSVALSPVMDDLSLKVIREADLVLLIGFDPIELRDAWLDAWDDDRQSVVSLDWAPPAHRIFPCGRQYVGDLFAMLRQVSDGEPRRSGWEAKQIDAHKRAAAHVVRPRETGDLVSPAALFHAVSKRVHPGLLMTIDVGAHRILANHVLQCVTPGQLIQSNGLGCMGYAIPAGIGASLAAPEKPVVAMLGDGCALMSLGEIALIAERELPVTMIILNDASLALIELKQEKLQLAKRGVTFKSPDFAALARGFGLEGHRVTTLRAFEERLDAALRNRGPAVIEVMVDPREYREQM